MTKIEFEEKIGKKVFSDEYEMIELVYNWHPAISDTKGKDQIAQIYQIGGMCVIKDMLPRARAAAALDTKRRALRAELEELNNKYQDLKDGEDFEI